MSLTGLPALDSAIHTTNAWIKDLGELMGWEDDRNRSYQGLRAVLHALRDHLRASEAADLAAQLPLVVRGLFYEGWRPDRKPVKERKAEQFLAHVAAALPNSDGIDVERLVGGVTHLAQHVSADLIVIGTHGRPHADHPSETERLLTHAPCPLLTTHDAAPDGWLPSLTGDQRIRALVPVDFSDHSNRALNYVIGLAGYLPLQVIALHVSVRADHNVAWARQQLAVSVPAENRDAVTMEVKRGTDAGAARDIADEEWRMGAGLLFMGAHARGVFESVLAMRRATARQILHTSPCPVWFIPASAQV